MSIDFKKLDAHVINDYDGLGYYIYLPALFIYGDIKEYAWLDAIDEKYKVVGGTWRYQISKEKNGNYVINYQGGVAVLQAPFFAIAHIIALCSDYAADGFSIPYQMSLSFAPLFYFILILFLLRNILLRFYEEESVALTLLLTFLASNAIQYIAIEAGQCHGYILPLYVIILWATIRWHESPHWKFALLIGATIGFATMMRPTEIIIFLIPLLWNTHNKDASSEKWKLVRLHKNHIYLAILGSFLAILPQIIYWLVVTGKLIHTVGSKWYFLNPYFRVIMGWQKGWFIYTPVTILFVLGLFFMKGQSFRKSVIWFSLINIWIVISWSVWRYGGSYSTRALVQSYPIFALALAALVQPILNSKWKLPFYILGLYLVGVNVFQIWQYDQGILRHDEMNRPYYQAVYLDKDPTALDISLLEGGERMPNGLQNKIQYSNRANRKIVSDSTVFYSTKLLDHQWIDLELKMKTNEGFWRGRIKVVFQNAKGEPIKERKFKLFNHLTKSNRINYYHVQFDVPNDAESLLLSLDGKDIEVQIEDMGIASFSRG